MAYNQKEFSGFGSESPLKQKSFTRGVVSGYREPGMLPPIAQPKGYKAGSWLGRTAKLGKNIVSKLTPPIAIGEAMYSFYKEGKKRGFKPPSIKGALQKESKYKFTKSPKKEFTFNKPK